MTLMVSMASLHLHIHLCHFLPLITLSLHLHWPCKKNGVWVPDGPKGSTLQCPKLLDADWPRDWNQHQIRIPEHHQCLQGTGMMTSKLSFSLSVVLTVFM